MTNAVKLPRHVLQDILCSFLTHQNMLEMNAIQKYNYLPNKSFYSLMGLNTLVYQVVFITMLYSLIKSGEYISSLVTSSIHIIFILNTVFSRLQVAPVKKKSIMKKNTDYTSRTGLQVRFCNTQFSQKCETKNRHFILKGRL